MYSSRHSQVVGDSGCFANIYCLPNLTGATVHMAAGAHPSSSGCSCALGGCAAAQDFGRHAPRGATRRGWRRERPAARNAKVPRPGVRHRKLRGAEDELSEGVAVMSQRGYQGSTGIAGLESDDVLYEKVRRRVLHVADPAPQRDTENNERPRVVQQSTWPCASRPCACAQRRC